MDTYHPAPRTMPHLPMQCLPGQVQIRADRTLGTSPNVGFVAFGAQRLPQSCLVCFGMRGLGDESPGLLIVGAFARSGIYQQYDGSQTVPVVFADPTRLGDVDQCGLEMQRRPEADTARHSVSEYLVNLLGHRPCHDFLPCGWRARQPPSILHLFAVSPAAAIGCTKLKEISSRTFPTRSAPNSATLWGGINRHDNRGRIREPDRHPCKEYDAPSYNAAIEAVNVSSGIPPFRVTASGS